MAEGPEPGVTAESPTAEEQAAAAAAAGQGTVTAPVAEETDEAGVPWRNRMAEMERKVARQIEAANAPILQTLQQLTSALTQQAYQGRQADGATKGIDQYTDEELAHLMTQGHSIAAQELSRRHAVRQQQVQQVQQVQQAALVGAQQELQELYQQHPELHDTTSELHRRANGIYQQRAAVRGANVFTHLDAVKTALLGAVQERPVQEQTRQAAVDRTQAIGGTSFSRGSAAQPGSRRPAGQPALSPKEIAMAKAMGVKDPENARKRFLQRQADGKSSVSPTISTAIGDI